MSLKIKSYYTSTTRYEPTNAVFMGILQSLLRAFITKWLERPPA